MPFIPPANRPPFAAVVATAWGDGLAGETTPLSWRSLASNSRNSYGAPPAGTKRDPSGVNTTSFTFEIEVKVPGTTSVGGSVDTSSRLNVTGERPGVYVRRALGSPGVAARPDS